MIFTTKEMTITNQHGRTVMIDRTTTATVPQPSSSDGTGRNWGDLQLGDGAQARAAEPPQWTDEPVWDDVHEGDELTPLPRFISTVQVFFYGLVKTNSHLIHYDRAYAQVEGLPERIAQGDLSGDMLSQTATRWMGRRGILRHFRGEVRSPAFIGETIMHYGRVTRKWRDDDSAALHRPAADEGGLESPLRTHHKFIQLKRRALGASELSPIPCLNRTTPALPRATVELWQNHDRRWNRQQAVGAHTGQIRVQLGGAGRYQEIRLILDLRQQMSDGSADARSRCDG